jgi:hypothetical protein
MLRRVLARSVLALLTFFGFPAAVVGTLLYFNPPDGSWLGALGPIMFGFFCLWLFVAPAWVFKRPGGPPPPHGGLPLKESVVLPLRAAETVQAEEPPAAA